MAPIKLGFVGLSSKGWATTVLAPPLFQPPLDSQYTLTALSTTNEASAAESALKWSAGKHKKVKPYHGDGAQIAQDPDVDLVVVSVKGPQHRGPTLAAIEAGKDVFVEWPAGKNLKETQELYEAAKKKGVRTIVGCQGRQSPVIKKLKEILDSGDIGKVLSTSVVARIPHTLYYWGPYIRKSNYHLTALQENGSTQLDIALGHFLEPFTYALGPITTISGSTLVCQWPTAQIVDDQGKPTGETLPQDGPTQIAFNGTLQNGAVISQHWRGGLEPGPGTGDGVAPLGLIWTIDGEKGNVTIESDMPLLHIVAPRLFLNGEQILIEEDGSMIANVGRAWEEYAKGEGKGDYPTFEDALRLRTLLDAISRSSAEGRKVDLT
ncbi:hypothetical protein VNI00_006864 [Paramarasmius palmivorus]|uniref:Gfo/Idh/MocA-like oxidoreductase N-terminal domain-containing protein n=1 Tax=Paramarasmius palmivorus TaxID=297713 RepID=A0AAW0D714_9AGAR